MSSGLFLRFGLDIKFLNLGFDINEILCLSHNFTVKLKSDSLGIKNYAIDIIFYLHPNLLWFDLKNSDLFDIEWITNKYWHRKPSVKKQKYRW